jgi:hypothetical protein
MNIAFKGQDEVAAGRVKPIKIDDYRKDFVEATGNVYGADDADTLMQAAVDYYYGSVELGSDVYDSGKFKKAIQAVKLEDYFNNMTQEQFEKAGGADSLYTETQFEGGGLGLFGSKVVEVTRNKALEAVHQGTIKAVPGKNKYIIIDPDTGLALFGPNNIDPLEFTIDQSDVSATKANTNAIINRYARSPVSGAGVPIMDVDYNKPSAGKSIDQGMTRPEDDGGTMTEFSIGVEINGVETNIPSLVPTLTKAEVETLRTLPEGKKVPAAITRKAADHARKRIAKGLNPFYQDVESKTEIKEIDELIAEGKAVENNNSGIPASRSVTVYPTPTEKEEAAGITPEPYVMMQQNYNLQMLTLRKNLQRDLKLL